MKQREDLVDRSDLLVSRDITARTYRLSLEAELPPLKNPLVMVFKSPRIQVSCVCSRDVVSPFGFSWLALRYSVKKPSLTKFAS